jgi:hypothetical protein
MKNWIIKKKPRTDHNNKQDSRSRSVSGVNLVMAANDSHIFEASESTVGHSLTSISEESDDYPDDHFGNVEFDLLEGTTSLDVMTIGGEVTPYSTLSIPLGSVHSAKSSQVSTDCQLSSSSSSFNIIFNSGCTRHMFLHRESFLTYKSTPKSYVILADKSKVPCLGSGTVIFTLLDKNIILHDVLHVPKL